jgi:outer membrane protein assembly factor BamB
MKRSGLWSSVVGSVLLLPLTARADDWPQFRGPGGTGISHETGLPADWGPDKNIRWKVELPGRGLSSPVVAAGKVYVTACTGPQMERLHVLCFDAATGKKRWERQFWATGNTLCHPKTNMAAPTPVTDGSLVYALFATGDLVCLDADGNLIWYRALARDYPQISNQVGMAASPILAEDVLLVPMETSGDSFAAGIDRHTGRNRWKVDRPRDIDFSTPLLLRRAGRTEVLFQSSVDLGAYDPASGEKRWTYRGEGLSSVPSPVKADELIILGGGIALRPATGPSSPTVAWKSNRLSPAYATPLCYQDRLYAINNSSIRLDCFSLTDGKVLWQQRVKGPYSASPVAGDGKLYLVNEDGLTTVFAAGPKPRVLATNRLNETILATPALADRALFLRSDQHLYCIAAPDLQRAAGLAAPPGKKDSRP